MGTLIKTRKIMQKAVDSNEEFKRGNLSAILHSQGDSIQVGQLPDWPAKLLKSDISLNNVYVVYSYRTPIAWRIAPDPNIPGSYNTGWVIPHVTYSVTTTHHQSLIRVMADNPGFYLQFGNI